MNHTDSSFSKCLPTLVGDGGGGHEKAPHRKPLIWHQQLCGVQWVMTRRILFSEWRWWHSRTTGWGAGWRGHPERGRHFDPLSFLIASTNDCVFAIGLPQWQTFFIISDFIATARRLPASRGVARAATIFYRHRLCVVDFQRTQFLPVLRISTSVPQDRSAETYCILAAPLALASEKKLVQTDRRTDRQTSDRCFTFSATEAASVSTSDLTCSAT